MKPVAAPTSDPPAAPRLRLWEVGVWLAFAAMFLVPHNVSAALWLRAAPYSDAAAAILGVGLIVASLTRAAPRPAPSFWLPAAALLLISFASMAANGVGARPAMRGLRELLPFVAIGLLIGRQAKPHEARRLLGWLLALAAILSVYGIAGHLTHRALGGMAAIPPAPRHPLLAALTYPYYAGTPAWRLSSTLMNSNYFGIWLALLTPAGWVWASRWTDPRQRALAALALGIMMIALAWGYSRAAALAALAGALILCASTTWWASWMLTVTLAAGLALATPADIYRFLHPVATEGNRLAQLGQIWFQLPGHAWLGHGPGTAGLIDVQYGKVVRETGVLGLAAFLALVGAAWWRAWRAPGDRWMARAVAAGMAGVVLAAIGGACFESPQLAMTFWTLAGIAPALAEADAADPAPEAIHG